VESCGKKDVRHGHLSIDGKQRSVKPAAPGVGPKIAAKRYKEVTPATFLKSTRVTPKLQLWASLFLLLTRPSFLQRKNTKQQMTARLTRPPAIEEVLARF
jgi:hypothetical protein